MSPIRSLRPLVERRAARWAARRCHLHVSPVQRADLCRSRADGGTIELGLSGYRTLAAPPASQPQRPSHRVARCARPMPCESRGDVHHRPHHEPTRSGPGLDFVPGIPRWARAAPVCRRASAPAGPTARAGVCARQGEHRWVDRTTMGASRH